MASDEPEVEVRSQYRRQKHYRACDFCRQRKVGCDAGDREGNRCSMCITHGMECKYDPAAKMKRPSKKYVEALETRLSKMEGLLKKLQSDAAHTGDDAKRLEDTLKPQRPPYVAKQPHPTWSSNKIIYPRGVHPSTDSSEEIDPSDNEAGIAVTDGSFKGYMGKSSNFDLVRTVIDLKSEHKRASTDVEYEVPFARLHKRFAPDMMTVGAMVSSIVPPFREQDFPPPDVMAQLVDLYFVHSNTYLGLLHRPTFESDLRSGLHMRDRGFGAVALLVCATGSAWAYGSLPAEEHQCPGWEWFNKVSMTQYSVLARPRLCDVQACALMAAYVNTTNSPQVTLPVLSLGIRMAQDVGAHRKKMYSATPTVEQELWKRAWWALVAMDRLASFGMGRQCTIQDEDFDVDPMTECDDEYWLHPDPSQAFRQPPGKPSKVAFCNAFIRLLKIEAFASRTIFTTNKSKLLSGYVGPEWKQQIVADIDSSLNKWLDTIPSHLRWNPNCEDVVFLNQSAILYANFYQLQIFVHRPFLPSPRRPLANANMSLPSMSICVSAARACLRVLEVQHRRAMATWSGFTFYALTPLQLPHFTVGIMLLVYLWGGAKDTHATLEDVNICVGILKELADAGNLAAQKLGLLLQAMSPIAKQQPSERSSPPSSSEIAKEGPQTIDDLISVAMQHLALSGFRLADGSDVLTDPTHKQGLPLFTVGSTFRKELSSPSPFVQASPSPSPGPPGTGMTLGQATVPSRLASDPCGGRGMFARDFDASGPAFLRAGPPFEFASAAAATHASVSVSVSVSASSAPAPNQATSGASPPAASWLGAVPTAGDLGPIADLPADGDFAFGNALMADDLEFFDSLSSMFGDSAQDPGLPLPLPPPPPPGSAPGPFGYPLSSPSTTSTSFQSQAAGTAGQLQTGTEGQLDPGLPPAAPKLSESLEVQSEGSQDPQGFWPGPWQWSSPALGSELWDQWGALFFNQGGAADANQPPSES